MRTQGDAANRETGGLAGCSDSGDPHWRWQEGIKQEQAFIPNVHSFHLGHHRYITSVASGFLHRHNGLHR